MDIDEILKMPGGDAVAALMTKSIQVPSWAILVKEYDTRFHPVMDKAIYPDVVDGKGHVDYVTRVPIDLIKVTAKRMTELVCGIPIKRIPGGPWVARLFDVTVFWNELPRMIL